MGKVAYIVIFALRRLRHENCCKLEVNLIYTGSSRSAGTT